MIRCEQVVQKLKKSITSEDIPLFKNGTKRIRRIESRKKLSFKHKKKQVTQVRTLFNSLISMGDDVLRSTVEAEKGEVMDLLHQIRYLCTCDKTKLTSDIW